MHVLVTLDTIFIIGLGISLFLNKLVKFTTGVSIYYNVISHFLMLLLDYS